MNNPLIVLASNNRGKLAEFEAILGPLGYELKAQRDYDVPEADEPYYSFIENALAKARHTSKHTGLPALADDSGLCVQALDGLPGVLSARFAAAAAKGQINQQMAPIKASTDGFSQAQSSARDAHLAASAGAKGAARLDQSTNVAKLRQFALDAQLADESTDARNNALLLSLMQGVDDRQACFVAALAYVRHAHDPLPIVAQGFWWGEIAHEAVGHQGFGYDPIFWLPEHQKTAAQLEAKQKNALSHRAQALQHFIQQLPNQSKT